MISYINGYILFPILEKLNKRDIRSKVLTLRAFEKLPWSQKQQSQTEDLYQLLKFCDKNIPYYTQLFKQNSFDIESVKFNRDAIKDLPILTKDIVRQHANSIKNKKVGYLFPRKTGGSTGQSVYFYYDRQGLDWTSAINLIAYEMAGKYPHHTDCHISADLDLPNPPLKHRAKDWLKLFSQNRKRLLVSSFADKDLKKIYQQLKKMRPYLLQGHPSSLNAIANYIEENGLRPVQLCKVFEPSGEMLNPKMVERIEKFILCKVSNRYGNAEFGVVAHSLQKDSYQKLKVIDKAFYVEECIEDKLIITCLTNYGFPLIRYDTGDIATVTIEHEGQYIHNIQGRIHDMVTIGETNYPTHYIMDFLDHQIKGVKEFQILLTDQSPCPSLKIVPEKEDDQNRIRSEILKKWGNDIEVKFIKFEEIIRHGWRQKFRHVIDMREKKNEI